ncbi:MAG: methyltransferase domain-containing protein [Methylococcales bacterium]|nr:methyltransferase domain-containing protein [Methylococcales bacterium]
MCSLSCASSRVDDVYEYLCVDDFLHTFMDTQSLKCALEMGLIDYLSEQTTATKAGIQKHLCSDHAGAELLINTLLANKVVDNNKQGLQLSPQFIIALRYRDLLEAKIEFIDLIAPDVANLMTPFIQDPGSFMRDSSIFDLFGYQRCFESTEENVRLTKRWMHFTSAYTKYEARVCMEFHDFSSYHKMLDIGGNSGEFLVQICKQHPILQGTVVDLPVVCYIGQERVSSETEANRIEFIKCNALIDPLPKNFDVLSFKSFLHDWPEQAVEDFINRASQCLKPGGTLLIFERAAIQLDSNKILYSMLPMLLFLRSFKKPELYTALLTNAGFEQISVQQVNLEMPFFLITAKKPLLF